MKSSTSILQNSKLAEIHDVESTAGQPIAVGDFLKILLLGAVIASSFALLQGGMREKVVFLAIAGSTIFLLKVYSKSSDWSLPLYTNSLGVILLVNVLVASLQIGLATDIKAGASRLLTELTFLFLCNEIYIYGKRRNEWAAFCIAIAFSIFGILNIVADYVGIANSALIDRTTEYASRYAEGEYRWQAPIYSAWQVSGMLRWSTPIILWFLLRPISVITKGFLVLLAALNIYILVKCEYRAAFIPLLAPMIWFALPFKITRCIFVVFTILYSVLAPYIFQNEFFLTAASNLIPDFLIRILGTQDIIQIISLSGRTDIWQLAIERIVAGTNLFLGQGQIGLNIANTDGWNIFSGGNFEFERVSYHQAVLDHLFIYGFIPGLLILLGILKAVTERVGMYLRTFDRNSTQGFRLYSFSCIALTNCHDGFFLENNFFYILVWLALSEKDLTRNENHI